MKNIIKSALCAVLVLPAFTACELDQYPTTSIPNEGAWGSMTDATNFYRGIQANLRAICASGWYTTDIQADYYQPGLAYGNNDGSTYSWSFTSRDMEGLWSSMYSAIGQVNNFLTNCDVTEITSEADSVAMCQFKSEAYFTRALAYATLVLRYCADYDPETADQQLGLPLVTTVDINGKPSRASLKATYQFIKDDLAAARTFIQRKSPVEQVNGDEIFSDAISEPVIDALEARINLYMEDYENAVLLADKLIHDSNFKLANTAETLFQQFEDDFGAEFIFVPHASKTEGYVNYSAYHSWNQSEQTYGPYYILAQSTLDAYDGADIRRVAFFEQVEQVKQLNETASDIYLLNKFPGNANYTVAGQDVEHTYYNAKKPFRIAEQYLIAAEASFRLGNATSAQSYLSALCTARGLNEVQSFGDQLLQDIQQEWFREFIGEGQRLDCLKRWHQGFTRTGKMQAGNIIMQANPTRNINLVVEASDPRFVWEIPYNDLLANPNLVPNWNN